MAKKKKREELMKWCWYCDREFEDDKILTNHQKAKHFKCLDCPKRLNTAGGLQVHMASVHKSDLKRVPNAIPGRDTVDVEIFGMEGIPYIDLQRHILEKQGGDGGKKVRRDYDQGSILGQFQKFQAKKLNPSVIVGQGVVIEDVDIKKVVVIPKDGQYVLWQNTEFSMEEERAKMSRYRRTG